jgi:inosine-uridine nucleoside N-ribohydrolase
MLPRKVIIDTDPGIDDAMCIFAALRSMDTAFRTAHPELTPLNVVGLTTVFGNGAVGTSTTNALRLLDAMGRSDIPVAAGAARPIRGPDPTFAAFVHGDDGLGNTAQPAPQGQACRQSAAEFLVSQVRAAPGEVAVLALGPLTNVARAVELDPEFAANVQEVIVMGGAYSVSGNVNPAAEANFWNDAVAADRVCTSGCPLKLLGLDVTQQAFVSGEVMRNAIGDSGTGGDFIRSISEFYFQFNLETDGKDGCYLHDPMTALAAMEPGLCEWRVAPVRVVSDGFARGHSMMVKPCYVGPTMQEPAFHADAPGGEHFSHRVAEIAVGVDSERAVALAVELLSFDLPARGSEARRREARL